MNIATQHAPDDNGPAADFIGKLRQYDPDKISADRRALAELRGVLRGQTADYLRAGKYVVPYLPDECTLQQDDFILQCYFQVGGLYAWGRGQIPHKNGATLGDALGVLRRTGNNTDSLDGRFMSLIGSKPDTLFVHLRQVIGLLRAKGIASLDWDMLLLHVLRWNHESKYVQFRWSKNYYRNPTEDRQG